MKSSVPASIARSMSPRPFKAEKTVSSHSFPCREQATPHTKPHYHNGPHPPHRQARKGICTIHHFCHPSTSCRDGGQRCDAQWTRMATINEAAGIAASLMEMDFNVTRASSALNCHDRWLSGVINGNSRHSGLNAHRLRSPVGSSVMVGRVRLCQPGGAGSRVSAPARTVVGLRKAECLLLAPARLSAFL